MQEEEAALMGQRNEFDAVGCARSGSANLANERVPAWKRPMSSSACFGLRMSSQVGHTLVGLHSQQSRHVPRRATGQVSRLK